MQLTKDQVNTILKNAPVGVDKTKLLDGLVMKGYDLEGVDSNAVKQRLQPEKKPSLIQDYNADAKSAFDNAGNRISDAGNKIVDTINDPSLSVPDKIVKSGSEFFKGIGNFIGGGAIDIAKTLAPQSVEDFVAGKTKDVADAVMNTDTVKSIATHYANLSPEEKKGADNALGYASGLMELLGVKGSGGLATKLLEIAGNTAKKTAIVVADTAKSAVRAGNETLNDASNFIKSSTKNLVNKFNGGENSALKATLDTETVGKRMAKDSTFANTVKEAQKQGFKDSDINFLSTVSETDKPVMKKMFDLAVKAQNNPRQITRAADVLGENVLSQVKQVQKLNSSAGKAVDASAKALKGVAVDATPLKNTVLKTLGDSGIEISGNKLNFSNSVFKNIPNIQKELQKVFSSIPDGSDAYQLHIFKKGIDEIVNYGTAGEGLRGQASRILKSFRTAADNVLDKNFKSYNTANTAFRQTKEFIDEAVGIAGKNVDLSTKEGAQAFGQSLRSAFSNNKSRGSVLTFIENVQKMSKTLKLKGAEQDILDQAIFVTLLEDTFGSEAATGLAGEVTKAINKAKQGIDIIRNPVKGGLNAIADVAEKMRGVSPEGKKKILKAFLNAQK